MNEPEIVKEMMELEKQWRIESENPNIIMLPSYKKKGKNSCLTKISINSSLSKDSALKALKGMMNGEILEGDYIKKFEDRIKNLFNVRYAISTSSGRIALYLILKSIDCQKGDEIIIPAYMLPILPQISKFFGLKPVFVDIDLNTMNMNPSDIKKKITKKTKIILLVHMYGLPADIEQISELANKNNIVLIEDCAHGFGATYKGKLIGTFGDVSYLSFNDSKSLNTFGGGMILTNNDKLNSIIRSEINSLICQSKYEVRKKILKCVISWLLFTPFIFSYFTYPVLMMLYPIKKNQIKSLWVSDQVKYLIEITEEDFLKKCAYKYTNIQAYIGLNELNWLEKNNLNAIKNAKIFDLYLKHPKPVYIDGRVYFRYFIRVQNPEELWYKLFKSGVFTSVGTYLNLPELDMFKDSFCDCPNSRKISKELIYIPIRSYFKKKHMNSILSILQQNDLCFNINPREKSPNFSLWDESHGNIV